WILFNIPCDVKEIKENISAEDLAESGIIQGKNDFGEIGYGGPCPPKGKPHRYFLKLYALDETLSLKEGATKKEVLDSISGHILAETKLVSSYQCLKED
ncbi:MAG: YbhB/YbcL family Raf kinase inhibitor-like protein, partial [Candidatus Omnitrophica bacterium]|nr:YbhB/YbcL family Raf kinase inhibitor-like protein [Candidatus Omnitrophota bacterium]